MPNRKTRIVLTSSISYRSTLRMLSPAMQSDYLPRPVEPGQGGRPYHLPTD